MSSKLPYHDLNILNQILTDYIAEKPALQQLVSGFSNITDFKKVIEQRAGFSTEQRSLLLETFGQDAERYGPQQKENVEKLHASNTFTVVTAHQPNLLFGPLYFILKTISTINLANRLNKEFKDIHVVPIFVLGSEDHDTEELNHISLFNNKLTWSDNQQGAFGRRTLTNLDDVRLKLFEIFGNSPYADELKHMVDDIYLASGTVAEPTKKLLLKIFEQEGLLVLDPDDPKLKESFIPMMKEELLHQFSNPLVQSRSEELIQLGYHNQVSGRDINLFYLTDNARVRIEKTKEGFQLTDNSKQWTADEMIQELEQSPAQFSPNVILRPLYQEHILPNLAYVGGGGELSYWFQLKPIFDQHNISFPILVLRNQVMILKKNHQKLLAKLGLQPKDLFQDKDDLIKSWLSNHATIDIDLSSEQQVVDQLFNDMLSKYQSLDASLESFIGAQKNQQQKALSQVEQKLKKIQKTQSEAQLNQINKLYDDLFPNQSLQERQVSFMEFYLSHGAEFIQLLMDELDPFDSSFTIIKL